MPRKPRALKKRQGTLNVTRDKKEQRSVTRTREAKAKAVGAPTTYEIPPPPPELTEKQREAWEELKPQVEFNNVYTPAHFTSFKLLVELVALTREGPNIYAKRGVKGQGITPTAYVNIASRAAALLGRFGLDPASSDRVNALDAGPDGERPESFLFGGGDSPKTAPKVNDDAKSLEGFLSNLDS